MPRLRTDAQAVKQSAPARGAPAGSGPARGGLQSLRQTPSCASFHPKPPLPTNPLWDARPLHQHPHHPPRLGCDPSAQLYPRPPGPAPPSPAVTGTSRVACAPARCSRWPPITHLGCGSVKARNPSLSWSRSWSWSWTGWTVRTSPGRRWRQDQRGRDSHLSGQRGRAGPLAPRQRP